MVGLVQRQNSETWKVCGGGGKFPEEVIYLYQVFIVCITVIVGSVNLCIRDRNISLWSSLVRVGVGYLLPRPSIERQENDVISFNPTFEQQRGDPLY